ncbi:hypothetical protein ACQRB0_01350 [Paratractidigestivibacter faecalis]|uniref:hypothetical protein n=1 Tax=Paratractidigestivibacter faecalis TaxID=2292441 RepID=UPI003D05E4BF
MIHRNLSPDFRSAAAIVASRALSAARGQATAPAGTLSVRSPDGTRTVIGTDGGIRQFVGDTTPPGRPTGVSWSSSAGDVTARWDGTLEGGVPADLDYVELRAGDEVVGRLRRAGSCSMRAKAGTELSCVALAVDVSGNASEPTEAFALAVRDTVAEVSGDASKALEEARKTGQMAVTSSRVEYAATASATEPPGEGAEWSATPPAPAGGAYTWMRTTVTYGDGRSETSEPVRVTGEAGADGAKGDKGDTGSQGPQGVKGDTGPQGVSVRSVTTFWRLDASRPPTPSGTADPSGWSTTEPAVPDGYSGKEWRCIRTVLSDGTATWTTPTEAASFAYAHAAWETAGAAMSQATSTSATLDGFRATVASNYQTKGGMSAYATATELRQTADVLAATASRVASQGEVTAAVERHMSFSADGLVISGGESDGGMSVAIMPDAQEFRSGEDVVMRLDAKTRSVEAQRVSLGSYQWRASEDGRRVSLIYVGGD